MVSEKPNISPSGRFTETEAAAILGVSTRTMRRWKEVKKARPCHTSTRVYYTGVEILRMWNQN